MTKSFSMGKPIPVNYVCADCGAAVELMLAPPLARCDFSGARCTDCAKLKTAADAQRELRRLHHVSIERSGIPEKYREWDETRAHTAWMLLFVEKHKKKSMWLGGGNGIGKTHTTHYVAYRMLIDDGVQVLAVRCSSWLRDVVVLRAGDEAEGRESREMVKYAQTVPLLILDDLGKETLSDPRAELLLDVIDLRDRNNLPIWITTNHGGKKLLNRLGDNYGPAIIARLARMIPDQDKVTSKDRSE